MFTRLVTIWDDFRASFWFVPMMLSIAALIAGFGMPFVDARYGEWVVESLAIFKTTAPASRAILSSIAGAAVTVVGVVFSITIVALSIAASQYGSRIIRTFRMNVVTHFTLGTFIATCIYCLLVLASVRGGEEFAFVPHLSTALGVVAAIFSLAMLIWFTHVTAISIQAPNVVKAVADDLVSAMDRLFPEPLGNPPSPEVERDEIDREVERLGEDFAVLESDKEGYIQAVDMQSLFLWTKQHDATLQLISRPGDFITHGSPVGRIWPAKAAETGNLCQSFLVGTIRTPRQDAEAALNELVEIAVRALSPGINDPFTAMNCIDRLAATLAMFCRRKTPSPYRHDDEGSLRVIADPFGFDDLCDAAFGQIRHHARQNGRVMRRLLEALEIIASAARRDGDRREIAHHADLIKKSAQDVPDECDRDRVAAQHERVLAALKRSRRKVSEAPDDGTSNQSRRAEADVSSGNGTPMRTKESEREEQPDPREHS